MPRHLESPVPAPARGVAYPPPAMDRLARAYRWLEFASFGPFLARCRRARLEELNSARRGLVLGDGDGRFLARWLRANPDLQADAVDASAGMLRLLGARAAAAGASDRVRLVQADLRVWTPPPGGAYDAVVSHFFLDFLTEEDIDALLGRLAPQVAPGAGWVVSEFAIPAGGMQWPARLIVGGLYRAFGGLTGLRPRRLPDHAAVFRRHGFCLASTRTWLGGLLRSELWRRGSQGGATRLDFGGL